MQRFNVSHIIRLTFDISCQKSLFYPTMFAVIAPNNKPVVGAQLCGIFVHPACAHLNLHSSPLLPPLTIWAARELGSNLVCSGRDYCASIGSLPLGDQRGSGELYEKTNTDAFGCRPATPPPRPHPYCMLTVLRQPGWTAAFRLCCPTSCFPQLCATF